MKKVLWTVGLIGMFFALAGCGETSTAGLRISNPDDAEVAYKGFFESNYTENTEVDGVTKASHKLQVFSDSDHIRAGFYKTDSTDSVAELNIKLYLAGKRAEATVTIPGDTAYIDYSFD